MDFAKTTQSVLTVGGGRGFVIEGDRDRLIITAGHCLPFIPPAMSFSGLEERTFAKLLASLGDEPFVAAECYFVDPIADIAVLGPPDSQEMTDDFHAFETLVSKMQAIEIARAETESDVWLLSLANKWNKCKAQHLGGGLWYSQAVEGIHAGMSGSPAIDSEGRAVGVVCTSSGGLGAVNTEGGPNANLYLHLPRWILSA